MVNRKFGLSLANPLSKCVGHFLVVVRGDEKFKKGILSQYIVLVSVVVSPPHLKPEITFELYPLCHTQTTPVLPVCRNSYREFRPGCIVFGHPTFWLILQRNQKESASFAGPLTEC